MNLACKGLLLGMQVEGLTPKVPLSTIARSKHRRNQVGALAGGRAQDSFGTIPCFGTVTCDDLHTY
jgi:hypothetical protein